jgi:hypothetical protein
MKYRSSGTKIHESDRNEEKSKINERGEQLKLDLI